MIYKYHKNNNHLIEILQNNEFYFAFAKDLNDPMDSKFNIINKGNEEYWRKWIDRNEIFKSKTKVEEFLINFFRKNDFEEKKIFNNNNYDILKSWFIICCFCEVKDNIKMWSHYADNHKGVCLGFETVEYGNSQGFLFENPLFAYEDEGIPKNYFPLMQVQYRDEIQEPFNNLIDPPSDLIKFLITKYTQWSEEKEHRLIGDYYILNERKIKFKKQHLKEIIFGLKLNDKNKKLIIKLITDLYIKKGFTVNFYEAKDSNNSYELIIKKINN